MIDFSGNESELKASASYGFWYSDNVDEAVLRDFIRAAVALNPKGKCKPKVRRPISKRAD